MFKITTSYENGSVATIDYVNTQEALKKAFLDFLAQLNWSDPATDFRFSVENGLPNGDTERDFGAPTEDPSEFLTPVSEAPEYTHADTEGDA